MMLLLMTQCFISIGTVHGLAMQAVFQVRKLMVQVSNSQCIYPWISFVVGISITISRNNTLYPMITQTPLGFLLTRDHTNWSTKLQNLQ